MGDESGRHVALCSIGLCDRAFCGRLRFPEPCQHDLCIRNVGIFERTTLGGRIESHAVANASGPLNATGAWDDASTLFRNEGLTCVWSVCEQAKHSDLLFHRLCLGPVLMECEQRGT